MSYCSKCRSYSCSCHSSCNGCNCVYPTTSSCVSYDSTTLTCTDIVRGDKLTDIIKKFDAALCQLQPPSGHTYTVTSCNSNIVVTTTNPDATHTNYQVCLDPAITTQLNSNTASIATLTTCCNNSIKLLESLDGSIQVTDEGSGTWNLQVTPPSGNSFWSTHGNTGLTSGNFIGTNDNVDFKIKVNGTNSGIINISNGNTAYGYTSLTSITSGAGNTAIGGNTLLAISTQSFNTAIGSLALQQIVGAKNTALGHLALNQSSSGNSNTGLGEFVGGSLETGSFNTLLGAEADVDSTSASNRIALGYQAMATLDNQFALPDSVTKFRWRGINYTMPTINAIGVLTNDGAGNLTWS